MKDGYRQFFNNRFFRGDERVAVTYKQFFVDLAILSPFYYNSDNEKMYM